MLAFDLVAAFAESTEAFYVRNVTTDQPELSQAPQQITLRFTPGVEIDSETLSAGITVSRSGGGGDGFGTDGVANDITVVPGAIIVNDVPNQNEVIIRFAETLPDDSYRITISDELKDGARNAFNNEEFNLDFRLELGARVVAVVPQPVIRDADTLRLFIDTGLPVVPTVDAMPATSNTSPTITGTATIDEDAGDGLQVNVDGTDYVLGVGQALSYDADAGTWSLDLDGVQVLNGNPATVYAVTVTATNAAGSTVGLGSITIDTEDPAAPTVNALTTSDTTPTITGTATVGAGEVLTVEVLLSNDPQAVPLEFIAGDGNLALVGTAWTLEIPNVLGNGTYTVTATVTDEAGNAASSAGVNLEIDTDLPVMPTVDTMPATSNTSPTITGTATIDEVAGDGLQVNVDGTVYTLGASQALSYDADAGTWSLNLATANEVLVGDPANDYAVTVTATNAAGLSVGLGSITIDTEDPAAPTVDALTTSDTTPTITGTATVGAGEVLTVEVTSANLAAPLQFQVGDGNLTLVGTVWTLVIPEENALADDTYTVTATVTDEAGNAASSAGVDNVNIDTTLPVVPTVSSLRSSNQRPTLTGTASGDLVNLTVDIRDNNGFVAVFNTINNGPELSYDSTAGTWELDLSEIAPPLAEGDYSIVVTATNDDGTMDGIGTLSIDRTRPTVAMLTTRESAPTITGTATVGPGQTLTVEVAGETYTLGDGRLTLAGTDWTLVVPATSPLADGMHAVIVTVSDVGGTSVSNADGSLTQARDTVEVYFNAEDPLDRVSASTTAFYRLVEINPVTGADTLTVVQPRAVTYDRFAGKATLRFQGDLPDDKLYRLEVGPAPAAGADQNVAEQGTNHSSFGNAQALPALVNGDILVTGSIAVQPTLPTPFGNLQFPTQPGSLDQPGHRETPHDSGDHGFPNTIVRDATGIPVIYYNFRPDYGTDPEGNPLTNLITPDQKLRAREAFELYSRMLGVRFVETDLWGITVASGDVRAYTPLASPSTTPSLGGVADGRPLVILNSSWAWTGNDEYGGEWFRVAMFQIGHSLEQSGFFNSLEESGFFNSQDLPSLTGNGLTGEPVFPGDYDLEHYLQQFPRSGSDIDVYSFTLPADGAVSIETIVARPGTEIESHLDTVLTLYRENANGSREMIARNDDYFGRDSLIRFENLPRQDANNNDYTYYVVVTSTGNTSFNPEIENSGAGGRTEGDYQLRLAFEPETLPAQTIVDRAGTPLDGDRDGIAGGTFSFWFHTAGSDAVAANSATVFVDKAAATADHNGAAIVADGTLAKPYRTLAAALAAVNAANAPGNNAIDKRILRIVGNAAGVDGEPLPYLIGRSPQGAVLEDGVNFDAPANVTVMIDAGAVLKFRGANLDVGRSSPGVSRAGASLQVLGTPDSRVVFTSFNDDSIGGDSNGPGQAATGGQWGGIVLREQSDSPTGRAFLNTISHADLRFGGGAVAVDGRPARSFAPIHLETSRPTIAFNTITGSGGAAISANPNSFLQDAFRVGPELLGNRLVEERNGVVYQNTINGLFIRIDTQAGVGLEKLTVPARLRSRDIAYVLTENLLIDGGVGGYEHVKVGEQSADMTEASDAITVANAAGLATGMFVAGDGIPDGTVITNIAGNVITLSQDATASGLDVTLSFYREQARASGQLVVDPGVVVKLQSARIELERGGSQLIAEGAAGSRVIFTSFGDDRFGAGGTFDTNGPLPNSQARGSWGGIIVNAGARASIDHAYIGHGGGQTAIEGGFSRFNVIEVHQGDLRLTNSRIERNESGLAVGDRTGRGWNAAATVFVRGAQPIIVGNDFRENLGATISINANALSDVAGADSGRSSGELARFVAYDDNFGPLLRANRLSYADGDSAIAGVEVRAEEITVESVWDDTDIVHVLQGEIIVQNFHTATGIRLMSGVDASLVVKLLGDSAGFTAAGYGLDIDDRIGGTVQVIGQPGYPVIMTSLHDDSVGASLDPLGVTVKDTGNDGNTSSAAGDWRGLRFLPFSNDRNVAIVAEREQSLITSPAQQVNATVSAAQSLGVLGPNFATASLNVANTTNSWESSQEKGGDENRRLGFEVHGRVADNDPTDVDVYSFRGYAGSEVWIDIDKTSPALDAMVELLDADGNVVAMSTDSQQVAKVTNATVYGADVVGQGDQKTFALNPGIIAGSLRGTIYVGNAATQTFAVDTAGNFTFANVAGIPANAAGGGATGLALNTGVLTLEFAADPGTGVTAPRVVVNYDHSPAGLMTAIGSALPLEKDAWRGDDFYTTNPRDPGMRVILPGVVGDVNDYYVRVRSQPRYTVPGTNPTNYANTDLAVPANGATSGRYELRIRLRQQDEKPGSTVRYADIRYPTIGIDVLGLPRNSLLLGEAGESTADNDSHLNAQPLGNLLTADRNTISVAGSLSDQSDVDWFVFDLAYDQVIPLGIDSWSTVFDIDYGDGFRGDYTLSVFDSSFRLMYIGRDSNIADDQPGAGQGADTDDLSRGSFGVYDPFIGPVQLPTDSFLGRQPADGGALPNEAVPASSTTSRYYVAVSSNNRLPQALDATFKGTATNSLVRLEPVNSIRRLVEDHIGFIGYQDAFGNRVDPITPAIIGTATGDQLDTHVRAFTLADVTLFVATSGGLFTYDAKTGGIETTIKDDYTSLTIGDLDMRPDGRLYAYTAPATTDSAAKVGDIVEFNTATGASIATSADGIASVSTTDPKIFQTSSNSVLASAFRRTDVGEYGELWLVVGEGTGSNLYRATDGGTAAAGGANAAAGMAYGASDDGELGYRGRITVNGLPVQVTGIQFRQDSDGSAIYAVTNEGLFIRAPLATLPVRSGPDGEEDDPENDFDAEFTVIADLGTDLGAIGGGTTGFTALAAAPQNLYEGRFRGQFFAMTNTGRLVLLDPTGPQAVTATGTVVDVGGATPDTIHFGVVKANATLNHNSDTVNVNTADLSAGMLVFGPNVPANTIVTAPPGGGQVTLSRTISLPATVAGREGVTAADSDVVTGINTTGLNAGMFVTGAGIPDGATIAPGGVDGVAGEITLSIPATAAGTVSLTFTDPTDTVALTFVDPAIDGIRAGMHVYGDGIVANTEVADGGVNRTTGVVTLSTNTNTAANGVSVLFTTDSETTTEVVRVADTGANSPTVNGFASLRELDGLRVGMLVFGTNIAENTTIAAINRVTGTITLDKNTINNAAVTGNVLRFVNTSSLGYVADWAQDQNASPVLRRNPNQAVDPVTNPAVLGTGIAFSPLDINLWHVTEKRGTRDDSGHGVPAVRDNSRGNDNETELDVFGVDSDQDQTEDVGEASMRFGLGKYTENPRLDQAYFVDAGDAGQFGVVAGGLYNWQEELTANPAISENYNLPGGAYGSLITNPFALSGYSSSDKPTLYFTYWLETEGAEDGNRGNAMRDSARVFASVDEGPWQLLATNNSQRSQTVRPPDGELPEYPTDSARWSVQGNQRVQELFDTASWRQARVDLGEFTGGASIRLRFDFTTAGVFDEDQTDAQGRAINDFGDNLSGDFASPERGADNNYGGFYIDDIIVGFAERGEMVTGSAQQSTGFFDVIDANAAFDPELGDGFNFPPQNLRGEYQLEIRRGEEYGSQQDRYSSDERFFVDSLFDTNDRFVPYDTTPPVTIAADGFEAGRSSVTIAAASWDPVNFPVAPDAIVPVQGDEMPEGTQSQRLSGTGAWHRSRAVWDVNLAETVQASARYSDASAVIVAAAADVAHLRVGMVVTGANIPANTTITAINGRNVTLSQTPTNNVAATNTLTFHAVRPTAYLEFDYHIDRGFWGWHLPATFTLNPADAGPPGSGVAVSVDDGTTWTRISTFDSTFAMPEWRTVGIDLASALAGAGYAASSLITAWSPIVTVPSTAQLAVGMTVADTNDAVLNAIPNGAVVKSIDSDTQITLSQNATATSAGASLDFDGGAITLPGTVRIGFFQAGNSALLLDNLQLYATAPDRIVGGIGDANLPREQGQFVIESNIIRDASQYGISIDAGIRDEESNLPHPGVPRNLRTLNAGRLVPGAVIVNNVVAESGTAGIRFSGDANTSMPSAVPYGRIVNNTIYGGSTPQGIGVQVSHNAAPTLLNNVFASLAEGIVVDDTSVRDGAGIVRTVVGNSAFYAVEEGQRVTAGVAASNLIVIDGDPFVKAGSGNFYPRPLSGEESGAASIIDSAISSLQDRNDFRSVTSPLGIPESPIITPVIDLYGQARIDEPDVSGATSGVGENPFIDIGAIDRVDFAPPTATLVVPLDGSAVDEAPVANVVRLEQDDARGVSQFVLQLSDEGIGIDKTLVTTQNIALEYLPDAAADDGWNASEKVLLIDGTDYFFRFLETQNRIVLESAVVYPLGAYRLSIKDRAIKDLAGNEVLNNDLAGSGTTAFDISLLTSPGQVTGVTVLEPVAATSVRLSFPPLPIDQIGGSAVEDFVVEFSRDSGTNWQRFADGVSPDPSIELTDLQSGDPHHFRVAATNSIGQGPWSDVIGPVTPIGPPHVSLKVDGGDDPQDGITNDGTVVVGQLVAGAAWEYRVRVGDAWSGWQAGNGAEFMLAVGDYEPQTVEVRQIVGGYRSDVGTFLDGNGDPTGVTVETTRPTVKATSDKQRLKIGETATITFKLSEAAAGVPDDFTSADVTNTGGVIGPLTKVNDTTYTAEFTPNVSFEGQAEISVADSKFTDIAGNENLLSEVLFLDVDTLAPVPPTVEWPNGFTNQLPQVTSVEDGAVWEFRVQIDGQWSDWQRTDADAADGDRVPLENGVYEVETIEVRQIDTFGNASEPTKNSDGFEIDTVPPEITIASDPLELIVGQTAMITFTLSDDTDFTTFSFEDIEVTHGQLQNFARLEANGSGTNQYQATFVPENDFEGTATISVAAAKFKDRANNDNLPSIGTQVPVIFVDTTPPTVTLTSDKQTLKIGETAAITFTLSEATAGSPNDFSSDDVSIIGGSLEMFTKENDTTYTAVFRPTADIDDGQAVIDVAVDRFEDRAGNPNVASVPLPLSFDTKRPTLAVASDKAALKIGETALITFTLSEATAGSPDHFTVDVVDVSGGSLENFTKVNDTMYTAIFTPDTETNGGQATIGVAADRFQDEAGNPNVASAELQLPFDTRQPTLTVASDKAALKIGETALITFTLSEAAADSPHDFTRDDVDVSGGSIGELTKVNTTTYTAVFTPDAETNGGQATIGVAADTFQDAAGNGNQAVAATLQITYDTKRPTVAVEIDRQSLRIGEAATLTFTLSEPATNFNSTDVFLSHGFISELEGSGVSYTASFTPGSSFEGTATVRVNADRFTDAAGNGNIESEEKTIAIDTRRPTVVLSSDRELLKIGEAATITFVLSEPSDTFTSDDVTVTSGSIGELSRQADSNTYTATFTRVSGFHGTVAMSVDADKFTDSFGNGNVSSNTISLDIDTIAPVAEITSLTDNVSLYKGTVAAGGRTNDSRPAVYGTTSERVTKVEVFADDVLLGEATINSAGTGWTLADAYDVTLADGVRRFTARATDLSDNVGDPSESYAVTIDTKVDDVVIGASNVGPVRVTGPVADGGTYNQLSFPITFTMQEPVSEVQVFRNNTLVGLAILNDAGTRATFNVGTLTNGGMYAFSGRVIDLAGNSAASTTPYSVTVLLGSTPTQPEPEPPTPAPEDPPAITSVIDNYPETGQALLVTNGGTTDDNTPMIHGTAPAGQQVTVVALSGGRQVFSKTVDSGDTGLWSFVSDPLPNGTYELRATSESGESGRYSVTIAAPTSGQGITATAEWGPASPAGDAVNLDFSEPVSGSSLQSIVVEYRGRKVALRNVPVTSSDNRRYVITLPSRVRREAGDYAIILMYEQIRSLTDPTRTMDGRNARIIIANPPADAGMPS